MSANLPPSSSLFTSESVAMGHPDKVCDQISDAILDSLLAHEPAVRAAVETLVTTGLVVCVGEVTVTTPGAKAALGAAEQTIRETIARIGYNDPALQFDHQSCQVMCKIHPQSPDISQGVSRSPEERYSQGAGDQGLMFGFACAETAQLMPLPIHLAHRLVEQQAHMRESGEIAWLRPDAKSQVTVEYNAAGKPTCLHTIVLSTQHTDETIGPDGNMTAAARRTLIEKVIRPVVEREAPGLWSNDIKFHINPTGRFVIGGPAGDAGLTGRKIIVDTYGGRGRHGGGAFSGKDPSKVDRSAAYMARHIAKNIVAAGLAEQAEVQIAYAIGVAEPVSVSVNTFGSGAIGEDRVAAIVREVFDLRPAAIIDYLQLLRPIYFETARHGHFGRELPQFTWEGTQQAPELRRRSGLGAPRRCGCSGPGCSG